uniref:Uncharacterized protein n=1 Tax=Arundo donax TaxID=35708 RepID=A0A0A9B5N1_ARUDO
MCFCCQICKEHHFKSCTMHHVFLPVKSVKSTTLNPNLLCGPTLQDKSSLCTRCTFMCLSHNSAEMATTDQCWPGGTNTSEDIIWEFWGSARPCQHFN